MLDRDEPAREKEAYLTVLATDNGRPQLDDVCTFKVTIEDVNDNSPVFDKVVRVFRKTNSNRTFYGSIDSSIVFRVPITNVESLSRGSALLTLPPLEITNKAFPSGNSRGLFVFRRLVGSMPCHRTNRISPNEHFLHRSSTNAYYHLLSYDCVTLTIFCFDFFLFFFSLSPKLRSFVDTYGRLVSNLCGVKVISMFVVRGNAKNANTNANAYLYTCECQEGCMCVAFLFHDQSLARIRTAGSRLSKIVNDELRYNNFDGGKIA